MIEILYFKNDDLEFTVKCAYLVERYIKARGRHTNLETAATYSLPDGEFHLFDFESRVLCPSHRSEVAPIFFEQTDYSFGVTFDDTVSKVEVSTRLESIKKKFALHSRHNFLSGSVNFENEIGRSQLDIKYVRNGEEKIFSFGFDVFPTKLDYRVDYVQILRTIDEGYANLVLDLLKKTYSSFSIGDAQPSDIAWWQIFDGIFKGMLSASNFILNKPHARLVTDTRYVSADRIRRWNPRLEERYVEFRDEPRTLYKYEPKNLTADTPENQFFKYALQATTNRFKELKKRFLDDYGERITQEFRERLDTREAQLERTVAHPFFRNISGFTGIRQESLLLQKGTGYSSIYGYWIILQQGIEFIEGAKKFELKNIADLYQFWCFLTIKDLLGSIIGSEQFIDVKLSSHIGEKWGSTFKTGFESKVSFTRKNGDLIELFHDFTYGYNDQEYGRTFTVKQRPDIVLRVTKNDLKDDYSLTYLYDAKYRLQSDEKSDAPDWPPEDAINQMHRYRDAIFYVNRKNGKTAPEKEIIGAYVLFPARDEIEKVRLSRYFRSIDEVNIGAFPLPPHDTQGNHKLIRDHLESILVSDTENTLRGVSPQKFTAFEEPNPEVLIGIVKDESYFECLHDEVAPMYFTGQAKPDLFGNSNLRYFAPYIKENGISEYFEIDSYSIKPRNEIFRAGHPLHKNDDTGERLVIQLKNRTLLNKEDSPLKLMGGYIRTYRYTKLSFLRNPIDGKIQMVVRKSRAKS